MCKISPKFSALGISLFFFDPGMMYTLIFTADSKFYTSFSEQMTKRNLIKMSKYFKTDLYTKNTRSLLPSLWQEGWYKKLKFMQWYPR